MAATLRGRLAFTRESGYMNKEHGEDGAAPAVALAFALAVAIVFAAVCFWAASHRPHEDNTDFAQIWHAAKALVAGLDPYAAIGPGTSFPQPYPLFYPLPAVLIGTPFTALSVRWADAAFAAISAGFLLFAVLRSERHRLLLIVSAPFIYATWLSQWSPLLTAAALVPIFGFLLVAKPTIGAALFFYRPDLRAVLGIAILVALSFAIQPNWASEWRTSLRSTGHMVVPIVHGAGPLLALAILRWRRPEARLLLAMACVPQTAILYEALPLALIPGGFAEMSVFVALSWVACEWWVHTGLNLSMSAQTLHSVHIIVPLLYLPCLIMVLRRPNEGSLPVWIDRAVHRLQGLGRLAGERK